MNPETIKIATLVCNSITLLGEIVILLICVKIFVQYIKDSKKK